MDSEKKKSEVKFMLLLVAETHKMWRFRRENATKVPLTPPTLELYMWYSGTKTSKMLESITENVLPGTELNI